MLGAPDPNGGRPRIHTCTPNCCTCELLDPFQPAITPHYYIAPHNRMRPLGLSGRLDLLDLSRKHINYLPRLLPC